MSTPLDDEYFGWLASQVDADVNLSPASSYIFLLHQLYQTPFRWTVANDDNRAEDGRELRDEFLSENNYVVDSDWETLECSVFEMLVALARRAAYETENQATEWFWHFLDNLSLARYSDAVYRNYNARTVNEVGEILNIFVGRAYGREGRGGIFPLRHAEQDQRRVELWYQLQAYLLEGNGISGV